ncbi:MotE family protein [Rhodopila sp.]|jgi:flagellar motility protein MotE (MotC chaperone)|uniref:MotE family protein n=1 Tax=Rhodopila sp. TaxID=2480087 RepID=UPI002CAD7FFD|nr:hypothetical protein [Rhodopila sp.]HVZ06813.1 hypothetical protein [Rhodopila sp.]
MKRIPTPRLLPITTSMIAVLLAVKLGLLVKAVVTGAHPADTAVVALANAADHGTAAEKKSASAGLSPPLSPPPGQAPQADGLPRTPPASALSDAEKALLQDLRQRRKDLDDRDKALAAREAVLGASEHRLEARVAELQALRKSLEDLDTARKQKQEAGWQGLVKLYEAMKPRDAATIFNDLSMPVLLQVMDRMKDSKAAAVMAAMTPDKAREVTAELARMRTGRGPANPVPDLPGPAGDASPLPAQAPPFAAPQNPPAGRSKPTSQAAAPLGRG